MENELFERTPIHRAYLKMAVPVVLSMVVQLIYNMMDTYFIALTGNTDLIAGVSVCAPLFTLMLAFGDIFGLGGSSVISRLLGCGSREDARRFSIFCLYGAVVFGVAVSFVMMVFRGPILVFLGADGASVSYASGYYSWIVMGAAFIIFSLVPTNLLRAVGSPNASMMASVIGAAVNMVLDPVFIFGLGMGAAGAAIATVIGYVCSDAFSVWFIWKKCPLMSLDVRKLRIFRPELAAILAIGLPASVTNFMQTLGMTITNRSLLPYGNESIAVMGIVLKVVNIAALVIVGLAFGGQPLMGYTYGAGNMTRFRSVLKFALQMVCGCGAVIAGILALIAPVMVGVFIRDEALIAQGAVMLRLQMPSMVLMGIGLVMICSFQSTGKGIPALLLSICRQGAVYAAVMAVMSAMFGYTGVISAQLVTDLATTVIAWILFRFFLAGEMETARR
ncbi:MAG: MATE family efflux transporter [[Clostridium] aminophilum]|uniref:MATE family efflux transporter n=1 Tax=[Clostridium] aminophilum TaxID=1526 RepID=UPI0026EAC938|nr:MATE family efflux transporter [[Clostridium] aminophilum]MDD6195489.1 MATE family efflux transporter [[Clostridium] aminophilum]